MSKTLLFGIQTNGIRHAEADGMPDIRRVKPDRISRGRGWLGLRASGDYTVSGVEQTPLLPGLLVLLLFLGLTMLAWHREGR